MFTSYRSAALVLIVATSCLAPAAVDAACNAIPDYFILHRTPPPRVSPNVPVFRYRGAVGTADRPYLLPAVDGESRDVLNLGPAVPCEAGATNQGLEARLVFASDAKPSVVVIADEKRCKQVEDEASSITSYRALGCARDASVTRQRADGYCWTQITMPDAQSWRSLEAKAGSGLIGKMRIVVGVPADSTVEATVTKTCAEIASQFSGVACIDRLYVAKPGERGIGVADVDSSTCEFHRTPEMEFAKLCKKSSDRHEKKCRHRAGYDTVKMYVDGCGNVRVGLNYKELLDPQPDPGKYFKRKLGGAAALPRFADNTGGPIRIPGREYLASTNEKGEGFEYKPRFEAVLESPPGTATEVHLEGDADKERSALALLPRRKAALVCDTTSSEEACEGVDAGETALSCKDDRGASGGKCKVPEKGPRYFVCESGPYAQQPCTRPEHCWPADESDKTGRCTATPKCWDPATKTLTATECAPESPCAGTLECGEPLFDLRPRRGIGDVVLLDRLPKGSERGVCDVPLKEKDDDAKQPPPTCAGNADCGAGVECVRYRLEAYDNVD